MQFRIPTLLGAMLIVGALCAGTAASASAAVWKDKGTNVTSFFQLDMTGLETVEIPPFAGSFACEVRVTLTSSGGSTAQITKWEVKACVGTEDLAKCKLSSYQSKSLPWSVTVTSTPDLSISSGEVVRKFSSCPILEVASPATTLTATPDSASAIKEFEFVNTAKTRHGFLSIDPPNAGTYGIG